jgi:hypothetical protein
VPHEEHDLEQLAEVPETAYRRRDWIARAQFLLPVGALLGVILFWGVDYGVEHRERYTPAPLARVHATWDQNCTVCHVSSHPLGGNNWAGVLLEQTHVADTHCAQCHAGPVHHANEKRADVPGCTTCHREHHGRHADLVHVQNDRCVNCHRDLPEHLDGAKTSYANVTDFAADHPEFRILRDKAKDPGRIEFNHRLHMMPGLREQANSSVPFTLADIPPAERGRYRSQGERDAAPIQLECASCHRGDASDTPRAGGAYMLPVSYDNDCKACHPLEIAGKPGKLTIRHGLQPAEIHEFLLGHFTEELLQGKPADFDRPLRPLPGKLPMSDAEKQTARKLIEAKVSEAEKVLFSAVTCQRCHASLHLHLGAQQSVATPNVPKLWYQNAIFDHTAHRAVSCRDCHASAYPLDAEGAPNLDASRRSSDVLLPGIATCRHCHAPARGSNGARVGGARFDCVECHRYHGGDAPLHGKGATIRHGQRLNLHQFLTGPDR